MADFKSIFDTDREPERIAKRLARAGVCSRRDAERLIEAGRVTLDGEVLTNAAINVDENSVILVDGERIPEIERPRLWRYHKPRGQVTTDRDPEGRPTVFDNLPEDLPRVISVGRLDMDSEGLLLLTNDGELARLLELPSTGWLRRYRVRVFGKLQPAALKRLADGITIEGVVYGAIQVTVDQHGANNSWLTVGLREGKNREIRRVMEYLGLQVNRLIRISFGPFQLGDLDEGRADEVKERVLRDQLGVAKVPSSTLSLGEEAVPKTSRVRPQRGQKPPRSRNAPTRDEVWYDKAHRDDDRAPAKGGRGGAQGRGGRPGGSGGGRSNDRRAERSGPREGHRDGAPADRPWKDRPPRDQQSRDQQSRDRQSRDRHFQDRSPQDRPPRERSSSDRPPSDRPGRPGGQRSGPHASSRSGTAPDRDRRPKAEGGSRPPSRSGGPSGDRRPSHPKGEGPKGPPRRDIKGPGPARRAAMRDTSSQDTAGGRPDRKGPRQGSAAGGSDARQGKPFETKGPTNKGPRNKGASDRPKGPRGSGDAGGPRGKGALGKGFGGKSHGAKGSGGGGAGGKGQGHANRRRPPSRD